MTLTASSFIKKGYIPLACNRYAGIAWQGEPLSDFWMWNRQYAVGADGSGKIQTVKVTDIMEAALRYWKDGWVPLKPVDDNTLVRMEAALREHRGLKKEGHNFPDTRFLKDPEEIPAEHMGAEVRRYLGLDIEQSSRTENKDGKKLQSEMEHSKTQAGGRKTGRPEDEKKRVG